MNFFVPFKDAYQSPTEEEVKPKAPEVATGPACACGKLIEKESPQIDQCLACFNRK